jgi:hypothetical protein
LNVRTYLSDKRNTYSPTSLESAKKTSDGDFEFIDVSGRACIRYLKNLDVLSFLDAGHVNHMRFVFFTSKIKFRAGSTRREKIAFFREQAGPAKKEVQWDHEKKAIFGTIKSGFAKICPPKNSFFCIFGISREPPYVGTCKNTLSVPDFKLIEGMVYDSRTELELRHISCSSDAPREVIKVTNYGDRLMTPCVFKPASGICSLYTIIPHGFKAVMTEYGKFIGVWKSGFHWTAPWVQVDFLIPQQQIVFNSPVKECPTQDNVMVQIDVTLLLQIKQDDQSIHDFVYNLGPARLTTMIQAFQDEAIRGMARKRTYNEIYNLMDTSMDAQLETTKKGMNERVIF